MAANRPPNQSDKKATNRLMDLCPWSFDITTRIAAWPVPKTAKSNDSADWPNSFWQSEAWLPDCTTPVG